MKTRDIIFSFKKRRPKEPLTVFLDLGCAQCCCMDPCVNVVLLKGHEHGLSSYQPFALGCIMLRLPFGVLGSLLKLLLHVCGALVA